MKQDDDPSRPCVAAFMAHPDDAELLCAGTLALLARAGWRVVIVSASPGDCGSPDLGPEEIARVRREEGRAAAAVIGGEYRCLELRDLRIFYDDASARRATAMLREVAPDVVITHSPSDYMLDHEETAKLARAACFNAPIPNAPVPPGARAPVLRAIPHLYYADPIEGTDPMGRPVAPAFAVDVSEAIDTKLEMLACHRSQREWLRRHHGMDEYLDAARRWAAQRGREHDVAFAEGFRQHRGHAYPGDNRLGAALGERIRRRGDREAE